VFPRGVRYSGGSVGGIVGNLAGNRALPRFGLGEAVGRFDVSAVVPSVPQNSSNLLRSVEMGDGADDVHPADHLELERPSLAHRHLDGNTGGASEGRDVHGVELGGGVGEDGVAVHQNGAVAIHHQLVAAVGEREGAHDGAVERTVLQRVPGGKLGQQLQLRFGNQRENLVRLADELELFAVKADEVRVIPNRTCGLAGEVALERVESAHFAFARRIAVGVLVALLVASGLLADALRRVTLGGRLSHTRRAAALRTLVVRFANIAARRRGRRHTNARVLRVSLATDLRPAH